MRAIGLQKAAQVYSNSCVIALAKRTN